jgi:hypothetical protein
VEAVVVSIVSFIGEVQMLTTTKLRRKAARGLGGSLTYFSNSLVN